MSSELALTNQESAELGLPSQTQLAALTDFCGRMVGTPFLPRTLVAGKTPDQQTGILLAVILTGREMGLLPMFSLRSFWLSPDGRLGMYADAMLAIMRSKGVTFKWLRNDNGGVKVEATRNGEPYTAEFTIDDAVQAGLAGKAVWKSYPKAMCRARCLGEIFRALCADMGGTQMYSREELMDMPSEDGETAHDIADKSAAENPDYEIRAKVVDVEVVKESTSRPETNGASAETSASIPETSASKQETTQAQPETKPVDPDAEAKAEYKRLLGAIRKAVPDIKKEHYTEWLAGWFATEQVNGAKPTPADYTAALKTLHDVLESDPAAKDKLFADALEMGSQMRSKMTAEPSVDEGDAAEPQDDATETQPPDGSDPIPSVPNSPINETFGWQAPVCVMADEIMRRKAAAKGDAKAVINALMGFGFNGLDDDNARALLLLYDYHEDAFLLRRKGEHRGLGPAALLKMVEGHLKKPITDFKPGSGEVNTAVNAVIDGI